MPSLRKVSPTYGTGDLVSVLASDRMTSAPRGATVDLTFLTGDSNGLAKVVPPGYFWHRMANGKIRVAPIVKATAATTISSNVLTVHNSGIFKTGEVLVKGATTIGTIASIDISANTITLAANAAAAIAVGDILQVSGFVVTDATKTASGVGLLGFNAGAVNLDENNDVACYVAGDVYMKRMPQLSGLLPPSTLDGQILEIFPEIRAAFGV